MQKVMTLLPDVPAEPSAFFMKTLESEKDVSSLSRCNFSSPCIPSSVAAFYFSPFLNWATSQVLPMLPSTIALTFCPFRVIFRR